MKTQVLAALSLMTLASARPLNSAQPRPLYPREVPQEHSHEKYITSVRASLALNNPDNIQDPVFALLGNAAAAAGAGNIADTECLQQATADQAFTNAKAANDVQSMTDALVYQALERNTGSVGLASNSCTSIQPVNAEIAAIQRHQDPASSGAAAINQASTLALAQQIQAIGGNVSQALDAGTFAPGTVGDSTGAGNTCDDANDPVGCIFTQGKLVQDFTADELNTQLASAGTAAPAASNSTGTASTGTASNSTAASAGTASSSTTSSSSADDSCDAGTTSTTSTGAAPAASASSTASTASNGTAGTASTAGSTGAVASDLGSCTSAPTITFGPGNDGRTEDSFAFDTAAATDFNHGSADNIKVLTGFAVQQLSDKCKASADTVTAATNAATAANAQTGQQAADTWNAAFA